MAPPPPLPAPFNKRVQLFTGKGGVGKTSVVAALALGAAARGERPLIVELGHRDSVGSIFGRTDAIPYEPVDLGDGVHAMNMVLDEAITDYIQQQVKLRRIAAAITNNSSLNRFFHAAPAVTEVVTLHRLARLAAATGRGAYSPILVDLDATGHALMFLELPRVFDGLADSGPLRAVLDSFSALLRDAETTALHLVSLPLALPAQETTELYASLRKDPRVGLGALVVNMMPPPPLPADVLPRLDTFAHGVPAPDRSRAHADVQLARGALRRYEHATAARERLTAQIGLPMTTLPSLAGALDIAALRELGERLLSGNGATQGRLTHHSTGGVP